MNEERSGSTLENCDCTPKSPGSSQKNPSSTSGNDPNSILYKVKDNIYVNLTNRCSCDCVFCLRESGDTVGDSASLWLRSEPTFEEIMHAFDQLDMHEFNEVVFCGYGEPTERFDLLLEVAKEVKKRYDLPIRVNTNGQGSLINERNIAPEFEGLIDAVSISLNTPNPIDYLALTRSRYGSDAYPAMLEFARDVGNYVPNVTMTTVETTITTEEELECQAICNDLGVEYRIRPWVD